ncbi:unnamed protein product [Mycena citricolor]|uniref:Transaldolase n=1 Tax=Mycena citricolor TaxID=2018698 RepID=A0AAD2HBR0_9AGAR|nr:unnamed protein product [Mycena citricolor]
MAAPPLSGLQAVRSSGVRFASDTGEYNQIWPFQNDLTDATTNPSLVLAAVSKPEYAAIVQDAVNYARGKMPAGSAEETTVLAMDRLLAQVGSQIARIVPGRVSVSVDPRIGYDTEAMIQKGRNLVSLLEELGIPRTRILIKIPATYEGIVAAQTLEHPAAGELAIHTNMTLIFGRIQAIACAQAGLSVISPFIGRVKDFWDAHGRPPATDLAEHPGMLLVRAIRATYDANGWSGRTHVMAAGFRAPEEIIEVCKYGVAGGPDLVTIPPVLLEGVRVRQDLIKPALPFASESVDVSVSTVYFGSGCAEDAAALYARDIAREEVAAVKVPEGLAKFSADAQILEDLVKQTLAESS